MNRKAGKRPQRNRHERKLGRYRLGVQNIDVFLRYDREFVTRYGREFFQLPVIGPGLDNEASGKGEMWVIACDYARGRLWMSSEKRNSAPRG